MFTDIIYVHKQIICFVFQASTLPMSIIIVGVGDADFEGKYVDYISSGESKNGLSASLLTYTYIFFALPSPYCTYDYLPNLFNR